jgi:hypothetical protein
LTFVLKNPSTTFIHTNDILDDLSVGIENCD